MIEKLLLKFGSSNNSGPVSFPVTAVTVFVGPNNSGKSRILREIYGWCSSGSESRKDRIIQEVRFLGISEVLAANEVAKISQSPLPDEQIDSGAIVFESRHGRFICNRNHLIELIKNPVMDASTFCSNYLKHKTLLIDGFERMQLVSDQPAGDLLLPPRNNLQKLARDSNKRARLSKLVHEAFQFHLVVDPTNLGQLRLRLSQVQPSSENEEIGIGSDAIAFHSSAELMYFASDGVKAFTGIMLELIAGDPSLIIIDEPEAFLYPPLAMKLGTELARSATNSEKQVFVSTHSPAFLMGCIQSGVSVNIVRLTYKNRTATARILDNENLQTLMRDPLLRSLGVLNGLFYDFVIVTEGDSDRSFYHEINERLLKFRSEWGIPNCLFLNAQGKQNLETIVRPLRAIGVPTAAIVDIDLLKDKGRIWRKLLDAARMPEPTQESCLTWKSQLHTKFESTGIDMKKGGGIEALPKGELESCGSLFAQLGEYGIFVVPGGEVESWLKSIGVDANKESWLGEMFSKMGNEPTEDTYVKPSDGDVWEFLHRIRVWLTNTHRKGMPD